MNTCQVLFLDVVVIVGLIDLRRTCLAGFNVQVLHLILLLDVVKGQESIPVQLRRQGVVMPQLRCVHER